MTDSSIQVGGTLGHVQETMDGLLLVLFRAPFCDWRPIRNCTGRYTCRRRDALTDHHPHPSQMDPMALINHAIADSENMTDCGFGWFFFGNNNNNNNKVQEFDPAPGRNDRILVLPLDPLQQTGIITYVKQKKGPQSVASKSSNFEYTYVHTLNTKSGFQRKLQAVGIQLD
jgi:hypothetical protein